MTIFITIAIFLCISYILYCELKNLESIVYWGVLVVTLWGLLHLQMPLQWWMIGNLSICFWDLSIGLLVLTSVFCLFRHIWVETIMMRKELWNLVEPLGVYINDVWQDKLFAFTLIAILVLYVASIISFITK